MIAQADAEVPTSPANADPEGPAPGAAPRWRVEHYRPLLMLTIRKAGFAARLRRWRDCSDVVQAAIVRALEGQAAFRGATEAEWIRWLQTIAKHALIDMLRQDQQEPAILPIGAMVDQSSVRLEAFLTDPKEPSPGEQAERAENLLRLARAIEELPPDQRDAFILKDLLGCRVALIADLMGKKDQKRSVPGLLDRARARLRERLADFPGAGLPDGAKQKLLDLLPDDVRKQAPGPGDEPGSNQSGGSSS